MPRGAIVDHEQAVAQMLDLFPRRHPLNFPSEPFDRRGVLGINAAQNHSKQFFLFILLLLFCGLFFVPCCLLLGYFSLGTVSLFQRKIFGGGVSGCRCGVGHSSGGIGGAVGHIAALFVCIIGKRRIFFCRTGRRARFALLLH